MEKQVNKGLAGLVAGETEVSKVDVTHNTLIYRGYDINELCEKASFIETAYLLLMGELPNKSQLEEFEGFERANRAIPQEVLTALGALKPHTHPMDMVKIGVSMLGALSTENELGTNSHEENLKKAKLLLAQIPTVLANGYRLMHGQEVVEPDASLDFSHNLMYMISGKKDWSDIAVKTMDSSLILYAEHGYNASTFSARVTASTLSDFYSAISTAIGTLKGPLHGGANEQVMYMLQEVGSVDKAEAFMREKIANKEKVMGFGHRLYRTGDSRVPTMSKLGRDLAESLGNTKWHEISDVLQEVMVSEKGIHPNLDFPAAPAYFLMGIPIELFTPIFAASRITGWAAHILEQHDDNRLIRPGCEYVGSEKREVPTIENR